MKKLLSLTLIAGALIFAIPKETHAQANTTYLKSTPTHGTVDTITNAVVKTQYSPISGYQAVLTIQTTVTKISGTTAGVVYLYGSLDNVNYQRIATDSLLLANVSTAQVKHWSVNPSTMAYYQIRAVPSGTQSTKITTFAIFRKP